jgi:transposase InsO family protein
MKGRRHTPEQIVRKLREADRMLGEGSEVPKVARALRLWREEGLRVPRRRRKRQRLGDSTVEARYLTRRATRSCVGA